MASNVSKDLTFEQIARHIILISYKRAKGVTKEREDPVRIVACIDTSFVQRQGYILSNTIGPF